MNSADLKPLPFSVLRVPISTTFGSGEGNGISVAFKMVDKIVSNRLEKFKGQVIDDVLFKKIIDDLNMMFADEYDMPNIVFRVSSGIYYGTVYVEIYGESTDLLPARCTCCSFQGLDYAVSKDGKKGYCTDCYNAGKKSPMEFLPNFNRHPSELRTPVDKD